MASLPLRWLKRAEGELNRVFASLHEPLTLMAEDRIEEAKGKIGGTQCPDRGVVFIPSDYPGPFESFNDGESQEIERDGVGGDA